MEADKKSNGALFGSIVIIIILIIGGIYLFYGKIKYKDEINQAYVEAVKAGVGLWRK